MNIFYNPQEKRLRALMRIGLQTLAMGIFILLFGAALKVLFPLGITEWPFPAIYQTLPPFLGILASIGFGAVIDRRPLADFGFHFSRSWWADLGFGLVLGAGLMTIIFLVEWLLGWVEIGPGRALPGSNVTTGMVDMAGLFVCVGIYEEMFTRGYQLRNLAEGLRLNRLPAQTALVLACLLSSALFGLLHASNPNATLASSAIIACAGVMLSLGFLLTGELAISIGLHIAWNFFQGPVFGFPVSGGGNEAALITLQQKGPALWTGGAFGPESGLLGLAAILLGCALIILWVRRRTGQSRLDARLATYTPPNSVNTSSTKAD